MWKREKWLYLVFPCPTMRFTRIGVIARVRRCREVYLSLKNYRTIDFLIKSGVVVCFKSSGFNNLTDYKYVITLVTYASGSSLVLTTLLKFKLGLKCNSGLKIYLCSAQIQTRLKLNLLYSGPNGSDLLSSIDSLVIKGFIICLR